MLLIKEPAADADFSQWGEKLYSLMELDYIILQSGLVTKKQIHQVPIKENATKSNLSYLIEAAK